MAEDGGLRLNVCGAGREEGTSGTFSLLRVDGEVEVEEERQREGPRLNGGDGGGGGLFDDCRCRRSLGVHRLRSVSEEDVCVLGEEQEEVEARCCRW